MRAVNDGAGTVFNQTSRMRIARILLKRLNCKCFEMAFFAFQEIKRVIWLSKSKISFAIKAIKIQTI